MKALVDTSFLIFSAQRGRDFLAILEEFIGDKVEPVILKSVLQELKRMAEKPGKKGKYASAALRMAEGMEVVEDVSAGDVDESIKTYASLHRIPVITMDKGLVEKLDTEGVPYMTFTRTGRPIVSLILR
jgi:rRNA-processing protein FCF1